MDYLHEDGPNYLGLLYTISAIFHSSYCITEGPDPSAGRPCSQNRDRATRSLVSSRARGRARTHTRRRPEALITLDCGTMRSLRIEWP